MQSGTLASWAVADTSAPYPLSAADFAQRYAEQRGFELVDGRVVRATPTGGAHGGVDVRIILRLGPYIEDRQLGELLGAETGFLLSLLPQYESVLAPDVAFVRAEHVPASKTQREGFWPVVPDFVAEVASPSQYAPELRQKAEIWLQAGVRLAWVVWPRSESVDVYTSGRPVRTLKSLDVLDGDPVFPGWTCPVRRLFP